MNIFSKLLHITNTSRIEKVARSIKEALEYIPKILGIGWFISLSKINEIFASSNALGAFVNYFKKNMHGFYFLGLALIGANWLLNTAMLATAGNKSRGKILNYIYTTFNLLLYMAIGIAFVFLSAVVFKALFVISMCLDPLLNLAHAIYFGIKALRATDPKEKQHFKSTALGHGLFALIGGLISAAYLVLLAIGVSLPVSACIAIGVIGVIILLPILLMPMANLFNKAKPYLISAMNWIRGKMGLEPVYRLVPPSARAEMENELLADEQPPMAPLHILIPSTALPYTYHYNDSFIQKPGSIKELQNEVYDLIDKIKAEYKQDQLSAQTDSPTAIFARAKFFWEKPKRNNKINALGFLDRVLYDLADQQVQIPHQAVERPLYLGGQPFHYKEKKELAKAISSYVLRKYHGVFQSSEEIGRTQACFNKAFLCMMDNMAPENDLQDEKRTTNVI